MTMNPPKLLKEIIILAYMLICASALSPLVSAQPKQDDLTATAIVPGGCYNMLLLGGNAQGRPINEIRLRILTPGFYFYSRLRPPASWTLAQPVPETVVFTTTSAPVPSGGKLTLNNICLDRVCQQAVSVRVLWQTFDGSTVLTTDTLDLLCEPFAQSDEVSARDSADAFLLTLHNRNSGMSALDVFALTSLTPGVTMTATAHNGWTVKSSTSTSVVYTKSADPLLAGDSLPGFAIVPAVGAQQPPYRFAWSTEFDKRIITESTLFLGKGAPVCDSLRLHSFTRSPEGLFNSYGATLRNTHLPQGSIDRLELDLRTAGFAFKDSAAGPWSATFPNSSRLRFTAGTTPLKTGDSLAGLSFSLMNAGTADSVRLISRTWYKGSVVCAETLMVFCPPTVFFSCDNLALGMDSSCTSRMHVSNQHRPESPVDAYELEMLSGVEDILSAVAPTEWRVDSVDNRFVRFVHDGGGIAPGEVSLPLQVAFTTNLRGQPFGVRWSTWYQGRRICTDDRLLYCRPPAGGCDSLRTDYDGKRSFLYNVTNTHQPPSTVHAISFQIVSANSALQHIAAPAAWTADSIASDYIRFVHNGGGLLPGAESGEFYLKYTENTGASVSVQWCTEDITSVICCQGVDLVLPEWRTRDSLEITANAAACAADLTLYNMHDAQRTINMLSVALLTPGREIDTAYAPAGWQAVRSSASSISFVSAGSSLPPGGGQDGFSIMFVADTANTDVDFEWCTWSGSTLIGCAQAGMSCSLSGLGCDSVAIDADASKACCFEMEIQNLRGPAVMLDSVRIRILTPDVILYQSTVQSPSDWSGGGTETEVAWSTEISPIAFGDGRRPFRVCFDNDAIANADFTVEVSTYDLLQAACIDTFRISCDETLEVRSMPEAGAFTLEQNYPNPFNPVTTIVFALRDAGHVTLDVLDAKGRVLATPAAGYHAAGAYRLAYDASSLPSGVYFARLRVDGRVKIRVMTLLR
jgi:hypothetical protein